MKKQAVVAFVASMLLLGGCSGESGTSNQANETGNDQLTIYTSTFALKAIAEDIGGEYVNVELLVPAGADPHTYEPTSKQMTQIAKADVFFTIGHDLEPYVTKVEQSLRDQNVTFIETAEKAKLLSAEDILHSHDHEEEEAEDAADDHGHGNIDPHVWLDPTNAVVIAETIEQTLSKEKPDAADTFRSSLDSFKEEAAKLDLELKDAVESGTKRELLVTHAAYGYLAERYGFDQLPIAGLSPSEEPSQKELKAIVEEARLHELTHVAFENTVTPKVAKVVQKELGAQPVTIYNLESVTQENMDKTYFELMRENVKALQIALR